jgi:hypothetical protein
MAKKPYKPQFKKQVFRPGHRISSQSGWYEIDSDALEAVRWLPRWVNRAVCDGDLEVIFPGGGSYVYFHVGIQEFGRLLSAPSPGHYFEKRIKARHEFSKLP